MTTKSRPPAGLAWWCTIAWSGHSGGEGTRSLRMGVQSETLPSDHRALIAARRRPRMPSSTTIPIESSFERAWLKRRGGMPCPPSVRCPPPTSGEPMSRRLAARRSHRPPSTLFSPRFPVFGAMSIGGPVRRCVFVPVHTSRETIHDTAASTHDQRHDRSRTRQQGSTKIRRVNLDGLTGDRVASGHGACEFRRQSGTNPGRAGTFSYSLHETVHIPYPAPRAHNEYGLRKTRSGSRQPRITPSITDAIAAAFSPPPGSSRVSISVPSGPPPSS